MLPGVAVAQLRRRAPGVRWWRCRGRALEAPVAVSAEDELVGGGLEAVDGGQGDEQGVGHLAEPIDRLPVGGHDGGPQPVSGTHRAKHPVPGPPSRSRGRSHPDEYQGVSRPVSAPPSAVSRQDAPRTDVARQRPPTPGRVPLRGNAGRSWALLRPPQRAARSGTGGRHPRPSSTAIWLAYILPPTRLLERDEGGEHLEADLVRLWQPMGRGQRLAGNGRGHG